MSEQHHFHILNLEKYSLFLRDSVASSFTESYTENLDNFISVNQIVNLIKSRSSRKNDKGHLIISADAVDEIFLELREWLYGVGLSKLASRGYVDCAWDDEQNTMVFWLADSPTTSISNKPS